MNLVSFSKPYVSPVDLKVKFDPMIYVASSSITCDNAIQLSADIRATVYSVKMIQDYIEKYKDDEEELRKLVDNCNAGMYDVISRDA